MHQRWFDDQMKFKNQCSRGSKSRPYPRTIDIFAKCLLSVAIFALICAPVSAGSGADFDICCMQAAREQFDEANPQKPWSACGVDPNFDFGNDDDDPSPSVQASLGWCKQNCPGYQASTAEEWLQPLSTWVIPALALLVLCSVGETGRPKSKKWPFYTVCYQIKEYMALLGDPASAICGAFSELWMDALMAERLMKMEGKSAQVVVGVAMLASQTEFHASDAEAIFEPPSIEIEKDSVGNPEGVTQKTRSLSPRKEAHSEARASQSKSDTSTAENFAQATIKNPQLTSELALGIKTVLKARADFVHGVIVPVVLLLASTASAFHDAYLKLGENDSAHSLAYGVWYSWLIILAVASNSYIASVNPGLANDAIGNLVKLQSRIVPLRMRVRTSYDWRQWMKRLLGQPEVSLPSESRPFSFYLGYLAGQTMAWLCVAFASSCAASISYNTPTIGIGCRSFSFLLYGVLAFVLAWLIVLRTFVESKNQQKSVPQQSAMAMLLKYLYMFISFLNAFVLIFSTIAQLVGLFRSCFCTHFGPLSSMLELSTGTELSIHKASVTWIPVGFVAFSGVWTACAIAVALRMFNNSRLDRVRWL